MSLNEVIQPLSKYEDGMVINTQFTDQAIKINDDPMTTVPEKIDKLKGLCKKYGRELVVKNLPKRFKSE